MASNCTKCGTALTSDKQFCPTCGAPVAAGAAAVPPFQPVTAPFQPVAAPSQPIAQPATSGGSSAVKIVLIIVAVFIGLGILGAGIFGYTVWRISRTIHVNGPNGQVTLHTPGGTVTANSTETFTASDLGTDIYPGAKSAKGGMRMTLPTGSMVAGNFLTSDSKDQVVAFYKSRFGSEASVMETSDGAILTLNKSKQDTIMLTITQKPDQYDGKTHIYIMHTINAKAS